MKKYLLCLFVMFFSINLWAQLNPGQYLYRGTDLNGKECELYVFVDQLSKPYQYNTSFYHKSEIMVGNKRSEFANREDNLSRTTEILLLLLDLQNIVKVKYNENKTAPLSYVYLEYVKLPYAEKVFHNPDMEEFYPSKVVIECDNLVLHKSYGPCQE